jgi:ATP-dependent helicase HepA
VVRSLITPELKDLSGQVPFREWLETVDIPRDTLSKIIAQQEEGIKKLLVAAEKSARNKFEPIARQAMQSMDSQLTREIERMEALAGVNPNIREEEIAFLKESHRTLTDVIDKAQIRLDAVRIILAG